MPFSPSKLRKRIKLSRQELYGISLAISRDFSPRLFHSKAASQANTQFSAQELLEISQEISREYTPSRNGPESTLTLLTISPRRLHAYWQIANQPLDQAPKPIEQQQPLLLRIYTEPKPETTETVPTSADSNCFDIPVAGKKGHQDIYLPDPVTTSAPHHYHATLGQIQGDRIFTPLAYSNTATVPSSTPNKLASAVTPFIMPSLIPASSLGKTASGQGKQLSR